MAVDWNTGEHSGLVDIGTHRLQATVTGPARLPSQPVVIIMSGFSSSMFEWAAVRRLLAARYRVLDYNRSGYGESEAGAAEPTAETIAWELGALLRATGIAPPYITVAHSWGGITSLEFLATRAAGDLAGMVFVDALTPRSIHTMPKLWSEPCVLAVSTDVDFVEVTGMQKDTALSEQEWAAFIAEDRSPRHEQQQEREKNAFEPSFDIVAAKDLLQRTPPVLGTAPVVVLRGQIEADQETMYQAGVARGNGTQEERCQCRAIIDTWAEKNVPVQKEFFGLTAGKTRFIQATRSGHNVQMTEPELVLQAVQWVMENQQ